MSRFLMATTEIRLRLGVTRQRVFQLTRRPDWPDPYDELDAGKVWLREDVEAWIAHNRPALAGREDPP